MNINGVSSRLNFGKTVRVNLSSDDAFKLANIINSGKVSEKDRAFQKDAKAVFDDTDRGKAVVCSPDGGETFYILSGEESNKLQDIRKRKIDVLQAMIRYIENREKSQVKKLISTTEKKYILSPYNDIIDGVRRLYKMCVTKK